MVDYFFQEDGQKRKMVIKIEFILSDCNILPFFKWFFKMIILNVPEYL